MCQKDAIFLTKPIEYFYGEDYIGKDVQDLIALVRRMDEETRADLIPTISSMLEMQEIAEEMVNLPDDDPKIYELGQKFIGTMELYQSQLGKVSIASKEAQEKLANIFNSLDSNND